MEFKQTLRPRSGRAGFTLIELIIVIAIIALLAAATFVAVNPAKRIGDANNAQRWSDATAIADAWNLYLADNTGTQATSLTNGVTYIISSSTASAITMCALATGNVTTTGQAADLSSLVTSGYIGSIPSDPSYVVGDGLQTGYYMYTDSTGVIKVGACETYDTTDIEVIR